MSYDAFYVTAVHEAGHAVISYALGRPIKQAVLHNEGEGEVLSNCLHTDDDLEVYLRNDPTLDDGSRLLQEQIRCDCAIALSGEIAEKMICGDTNISPEEILRDQKLSWNKAAYLHVWTAGACPNMGYGTVDQTCSSCNEILVKVRKLVKQIISKPKVRNAIENFAQELKGKRQLNGGEITEFFNGQEILFGTEVEGFLCEN